MRCRVVVWTVASAPESSCVISRPRSLRPGDVLYISPSKLEVYSWKMVYLPGSSSVMTASPGTRTLAWDSIMPLKP